MTFDILIVVVTPVTHFKVEEKKEKRRQVGVSRKRFFFKIFPTS